MGDLTRNFSASEFRCKPSLGMAVCEYCASPAVTVDPRLAAGLQSVRDKANAAYPRPEGQPERPLRIRSGHRCGAKNSSAAISGRGSSKHLLEPVIAADISVDGLTWHQLYEICLTEPEFLAGGVGVYPGEGTVHVDVRDAPARWARVKGKYVGIEQGLALA